MLTRRGLVLGLLASAATLAASPLAEASQAADGAFKPKRRWDFLFFRKKKPGQKQAKAYKQQKGRKPQTPARPVYEGATVVSFSTPEKPGTIVIKTSERALYQVLGNGKAKRYLVAVGKEGFSWSGTARVGMKAVNPRWTPPPEMIARTPRYAKWAKGMPGGIPQNPLGVRAIYLFNKAGDTGFRIHGTNAPSSIGTAASSGCIRMLNNEVVELYNTTRMGAKVIVL